MLIRLDKLSVRPAPFSDESAAGYLRRIAVRNGYRCGGDFLSAYGYVASASIAWPMPAEPENAVELLPRRDAYTSAKAEIHTLYQYARYCPLCLKSHRYWRSAWENALVPVCLVHQSKLIGRCGKCKKAFITSQIGLDRCACGASLVRVDDATLVDSCTLALGRLLLGERDLTTDVAHGFPSELASLETPELMRLVLFLGAYRQFGKQAKPRKLSIKSNVDSAFAVLTGAVQTLAHWPLGIAALVESYLKSDGPARSVRQRLGYLYIGIHKEFAEPQFGFLRNAFDQYVLSYWPDLIDQKSRWIGNIKRDQHFISGTRIAKDLGVPLRLLREWVATQQLEGTIRHLPSGRTQLALRKGQEQRIARLSRVLNLAEAAAYLGLPEKRLRELLVAKLIFGQKPVAGAQWKIHCSELDRFIEVIKNASSPHGVNDVLSLDQIFRCRWTENWNFIDLMNAIRTGEIITSWLPDRGKKNLEHLRVDVQSLNAWSGKADNGLSIPAVCELLKIKQEVGYHLVNKNLLVSRDAGRLGRRIDQKSLDQFNCQYCFARDVALANRTSPRALVQRLRDMGVEPISGPAIDGGRQVIYARSDICAAGYL